MRYSMSEVPKYTDDRSHAVATAHAVNWILGESHENRPTNATPSGIEAGMRMPAWVAKPMR